VTITRVLAGIMLIPHPTVLKAVFPRLRAAQNLEGGFTCMPAHP
jgi:hypothetical protein